MVTTLVLFVLVYGADDAASPFKRATETRLRG